MYQKKSIILLSTHNVTRIDISSLLPFHSTFQIPRFEFRRGCKSLYAVSSRYSRFAFTLTFVISRVTKLKKKKNITTRQMCTDKHSRFFPTISSRFYRKFFSTLNFLPVDDLAKVTSCC